ncbi:hypothetical protein INR49_017771 [Caranx melampygus]|nr:hypothetical protein INR49_017771 [Caranx melampygus]
MLLCSSERRPHPPPPPFVLSSTADQKSGEKKKKKREELFNLINRLQKSSACSGWKNLKSSALDSKPLEERSASVGVSATVSWKFFPADESSVCVKIWGSCEVDLKLNVSHVTFSTTHHHPSTNPETTITTITTTTTLLQTLQSCIGNPVDHRRVASTVQCVYETDLEVRGRPAAPPLSLSALLLLSYTDLEIIKK